MRSTPVLAGPRTLGRRVVAGVKGLRRRRAERAQYRRQDVESRPPKLYPPSRRVRSTEPVDQPSRGERRDGLRGLDSGGLIERIASARPVAVVIPVYNGGIVVERCLRTVLLHTRENVRLVVADDGSTDPETLRILRNAGPRVEVIRSAENQGYTRNVNRAIAAVPDCDVVLLNSDTQVGPLWLQRLQWVAYGSDRVGAVSAVSDSAGAMSVPSVGLPNDWHSAQGWLGPSRAMTRYVRDFELTTPTAHGFCSYLRREALDDVGPFDEQRFPRGYGEENDWSMRARGRSWKLTLAPHVIVRHERGASFGSARDELLAQARVTMAELHPEYRLLVRRWQYSQPMKRMRQEAAVACRVAIGEAIRPRRLYVIHVSSGGTPETNRDLMMALADEQESFLLAAAPNLLTLYQLRGDHLAPVEEWRPSSPFTLHEDWRADLAAYLTRLVIDRSFELIHVRHLLNQPLRTVTEVAARLGIPLVVSTHDFYFVCPSVHLLDGEGRYCGGVCTSSSSTCSLPTPFVRSATNLKHREVYTWRERAEASLSHAQAIIATTPSALAVHAQHFPALQPRMRVIEHGRSVDLRSQRPLSARRPGPLRVFAPAHWAAPKGIDLLHEIIERTGPLIEWHVAGRRSDRIHPDAISHGEYARDAIGELIEELDPDFVGLFSVWPETYSHTLTEAWAAGVPVLATDLGAFSDRVRAHGGGILLSPFDIEETVATIRELGRRLLAGRAVDVPPLGPYAVRSRGAMAQDYVRLYDELEHGVSPGSEVALIGGSRRLAWNAEVAQRAARAEQLSGHRFRSASVRGFATATDDRRFDVVLIAADALDDAPPELYDFVLHRLERERSRLVVQLPALDSVDSAMRRRSLLERADAIIVPPGMALDGLGGSARRVAEVPTAVDPRAWAWSSPRMEVDPPARGERWGLWSDPRVPEFGWTADRLAELLRRPYVDVVLEAAPGNRPPPTGIEASGTDPVRRASRIAALARRRGWVGAVVTAGPGMPEGADHDPRVLEAAILGIPAVVVMPEYSGQPLVRDGVVFSGVGELGAARRLALEVGVDERLLVSAASRSIDDPRGIAQWLSVVVGAE